MQQPPLLNALIQKNTTGLPGKDFLLRVTKQHPYFTPAQFYLLQQMTADEATYNQQVTKTSVLFNNPYWLNFQLQQTNTHAAEKEAAITSEAILSPENEYNNADDIVIVEDQASAVEETIIPENFDNNIAADAITSSEMMPVENAGNDENMVMIAEEILSPEEIIVTDNNTVEISDNNPVEMLPEEIDHQQYDNTLIPNEAILSPEETNTDNTILEIAEDYPAEILTEEKSIAHQNDNVALSNEVVLSPEEMMLAQDPDITEEQPITEEEIEPMKITIPAPVTGTTDDNALTFEPMHLVDYFASQGIKLSEEVQTADKLGKQLKSFTEWLKTMKKIHVPTESLSTANQDITVQTLAEKSNAEGEVLTEAMAEVLTQQGKAGKAIEVYKKLSLLNPPKSAYFAAKIEQLKGS